MEKLTQVQANLSSLTARTGGLDLCAIKAPCDGGGGEGWGGLVYTLFASWYVCLTPFFSYLGLTFSPADSDVP